MINNNTLIYSCELAQKDLKLRKIIIQKGTEITQLQKKLDSLMGDDLPF